jgi:hypothetical protein
VEPVAELPHGAIGQQMGPTVELDLGTRVVHELDWQQGRAQLNERSAPRGSIEHHCGIGSDERSNGRMVQELCLLERNAQPLYPLRVHLLVQAQELCWEQLQSNRGRMHPVCAGSAGC